MIRVKVKTRRGEKPIVTVAGDITSEAGKVNSMKSLLKALEDLGSALEEIYHEGFVEGCLDKRPVGEGHCNIVLNVRGENEVAKQVYLEIEDEF